MNRKLIYRIGIPSLLGFICLSACSQPSETTSQSSDLPALTKDFSNTEFAPMTARSGTFSLMVPKDWVSSSTDSSNDFAAHSAGNDYFLTANRYEKVDIPLSLEDFARSVLSNSPELEAEGSQLIPTSIGGEDGLLLTKEMNQTKQLLLFFYEKGDDYRLISLIAHPDNKASIQEFLTHAIIGWQTIAVDTYSTLEFNQTITIPNSSLTVTIPSSWMHSTEESSDETSVFQDTSNSIRLAIRGVSTTGYAVDLNAISDDIVSQNQAPDKETITIGQQQGYRITFQQTSEGQNNYTVSIYVFHINDTLVTFTISSKVSNSSLAETAMETIIASLN